MADTEQLIHKRYQLQRMIAQGRACPVYQAFDLVLQRSVAVKLVPNEYMNAYKSSIRLTASFSHPNIIGTYDFVQEANMLYLVQEYVDGDTFSAMVQTQLAPYTVADLGVQICQALTYAGASPRGVCHGDLTPATIVRDRRGLVRISDFALPSDMQYFHSWSMVGGAGNALADPELPWGRISEGRSADDTRAVGLLLYQLLAGRAAGAPTVEPPADGRLRFLRNVPVDLCEVIARAIVLQHPQHISTPEMLYEELMKQTETLEPVAVELSPTPVAQPREQFTSRPLVSPGSPNAPRTGKLVTSLPSREMGQGGGGLSPLQSEANGPLVAMEQQTPPQSPFVPMNGDAAPKLVTARPYNTHPEIEARPALRLSTPILIALCIFIFVLFFVVGYFIAHAVLP